MVTVALKEKGPAAKEAIPALLHLLDDTSNPYAPISGARICDDAMFAHANMGPASVPSLIDALRHSSPRVRCLASEALGKIGKSAVDAIPHLAATEVDECPGVRLYSRNAKITIQKEVETHGHNLITNIQVDF